MNPLGPYNEFRRQNPGRTRAELKELYRIYKAQAASPSLAGLGRTDDPDDQFVTAQGLTLPSNDDQFVTRYIGEDVDPIMDIKGSDAVMQFPQGPMIKLPRQTAEDLVRFLASRGCMDGEPSVDCLIRIKGCKEGEDRRKCGQRLNRNAMAQMRRVAITSMMPERPKKERKSRKGIKLGPRQKADIEMLQHFFAQKGCDRTDESLEDCWKRMRGCKAGEEEKKCVARLRRNAMATFTRARASDFMAKPRGRPPLSPEQKAANALARRAARGGSLIGGCMMSRDEILHTLRGL